ncbi:bilirubin oxidase, partial [Xylariales sp. PMI_506]
LTVALSLTSGAVAKDWLSPPYLWLYSEKLPIPSIKAQKWPDRPLYNNVTGNQMKYYEIEIKEFSQQVYPAPKFKAATLVGYDGTAPGPTFFEEKGTESVVRFINHGKLPNSVHLHGSYSRTPFDGWAEDTTAVGQYKDYYYPNGQSARMLWYHDHAIDHTAENAYYGQAGVYYLHDNAEDSLGLPGPYGQYDIPLVLAAKQYNQDGTLYSPAAETTSLYGDVIHVNGAPWPYLKVEPRRYRFRFLDASISRSFYLYFEQDTDVGKKLDFYMIGTDSGLMDVAQKVQDFYISMAERYEVVFDFSNYKGKNITLRNTRAFAADEDFLHTDKVMKFIVSDTSVQDSSRDLSKSPALRTVPFPPDKSSVDHHFKFERQGGDWTINGVTFSDPVNRILAKPQRGLVEVWELENTSGGWSHPIHIHLVDFKVVKRVNGRGVVQPAEAHGLKDVVWLGPGETVTVEAYYAPWPGLYMFHCHNLIHEDHEMMAAFNVSIITDMGYTENAFADPMEETWRAKAEGSTGYDWDSVQGKLWTMAAYKAYDDVGAVESRLQAYWATKTAGGGAAPTTLTTSTVKTTTTS